MDNFIQIIVFCPPEPRVGAFVYRNVSLRSKRFQSSYTAKFEAGAKKKKIGRGSSSFLDELARNRLLRRLQECGKGLLVATLDSTESSSFISSFSSVRLGTVNPLLNPLSKIFPPSLIRPPFQGKKVDKPPLPSPLLFFTHI